MQKSLAKFSLALHVTSFPLSVLLLTIATNQSARENSRSYCKTYHISHRMISYIISPHLTSPRLTSRHVIYHVVSYHISRRIVSYITSYRIIYHIVSYHISHRIVSYITSYRIIYHIVSYHISHRIVSYHISITLLMKTYFLCFSVPGPFGERDDQQVFIQKLVPDTDHVIVRFSSTGKR